MDSRHYPEGRAAAQSRYIRDVLVEFGVLKTLRQRVAIAALLTTSTPFTAMPALPGVRWRLMDARLISIGGAVTTATSVNICGVVSAAVVELLVVAAAALTQSALVRAGAANAVILANGASFTQMDANTAVSFKAVGALVTVATHVDFSVDYVADAA